MAMRDDLRVSVLLLVRNSVDHDARVLRAAKVAEGEFSEIPLVIGVATDTGSAGAVMMDGSWVVRFALRVPFLALKRRAAMLTSRARTKRSSRGNKASHAPTRVPVLASTPSASRLTATTRAGRTLSGLSFALKSLLLAWRVKPRVVHANDWNTMWCGLAIKLACGSRLVYDSHELWADRNGRWEWRAWLIASEALFVRIADEVITSSPGYARALAARYRVREPEVVRNIPESAQLRARPEPVLPSLAPGVSGPRSRQDTEIPVALDQPTRQDASAPARVAYVGGLMPGRGLEQMIDALALLPEIELYAVGPGAAGYRDSLLARSKTVGVEDRVELKSPVAPREVGDALVGAAAGLCLIQPVCRSYELCLPNKLFEYAAAGVPILASDMPVIAAVVRDKGLGEVVAHADPHAIAAGLERLLQPERWGLVAERVRSFAAAHDWAGEACGLAGVYERAVDGLAT